MRRASVIKFEGVKFTLSLIPWGVLKRAIKGRLAKTMMGVPFVPRYELAVWTASVFQPDLICYFPDEHSAMEGFAKIEAAIKQDGFASPWNILMEDQTRLYLAPYCRLGKMQEDTVEHLAQMITDMQNPKPKRIDEAAIEGFKISGKFGQFLTKCKTEIGKDAATIGVADTEDEGGVMFVHKDLEERIEKEDELDKLQLKLALANYPIPNSSYQFNKGWPKVVAKFHGLLNSEEVIRDKAVALATFVVHNLDIALNFYDHSHESKADWIFEGVNGEDEQRARIQLEEAAIWTRVVVELCRKWLLMSSIASEGWAKMTEEQKTPIRQLAHLFVDHFYGELAFLLGVQRFTPPAIWSALNDRAYEYGAYHEWFAEKDKPAKNTLFWEAPIRVGELFGGSAVKNVTFIVTYAGMFMERIQQAQIEELMTGLSLAAESRGTSQAEKKA